jgi:hypothetical protein
MAHKKPNNALKVEEENKLIFARQAAKLISHQLSKLENDIDSV